MDHDTLSDVLRNVRLRGAVFFSVSGNSGWVAEAPPARQIAPLLLRGVEHVMEYHVVAAGTCWVAIEGGASVQLFAGDVVMFPHGDAHVVSSGPGMRGSASISGLNGCRSQPRKPQTMVASAPEGGAGERDTSKPS